MKAIARALSRLLANPLEVPVFPDVVGGNRICAAWGHAAYRMGILGL